MPKFQLISGYINVAGSRDNVVFRGGSKPMTYPEVSILRAIHGGQQHVHTLVDEGEIEIDEQELRAQLNTTYGHKLVSQVLPVQLGLPAGDTSIPTREEVSAADKAAAEARAQVREGKQSAAVKLTPEPEPDPEPVLEPAPAKTKGKTPEVPSLDELPE